MAIDLPGHGRSSHRPPGSLYHVQDYIADVKYVIDGEPRHIAMFAVRHWCHVPDVCLLLALKWDKFAFLAHSMGEPFTCTFTPTLCMCAYCYLVLIGVCIYMCPDS